MKDRQLMAFRTYFLLGLTIAFISLFMEWYVFQGIDSTKTIVIDWSYHLLFDWYSPSKLTTELNGWYKPENASVPLPLVMFFIGVLMIASYGALFYSPEPRHYRGGKTCRHRHTRRQSPCGHQEHPQDLDGDQGRSGH